MRVASLLVAALALAACQVNLEGAPCAEPGKDTDCPAEQACGNDHKCSTRAAACAATRCDLEATSCNGKTAVLKCSADADPVCGSWQVQSCGANLSCVERGTNHACECDPNGGTEFAAGAGGGAVGSGPWYPTGLETPPQCRFKRLGDALAAAVSHGGPTTVKVYGDSAIPGAAVTFTGETFPLTVPTDVTISGADSPAGETILQGDAGTSSAMVALQGTLERVHLQNVSMTGNGVDTSCGGSGSTPTLRDVVVSAGTQKLLNGIAISGSCGALLERVDVSGASGAALDVSAPATVTVKGSNLHESGIGIQATGGALLFETDPTSSLTTKVTGNTGVGVFLKGTGAAVDATFSNVLVAANGATGVVVDRVPPLTSKLRLTSCDVHGNGVVSPMPYGPSGSTRLAGGILLNQASLSTFQFQGNQVYGNHSDANGADEIAFDSTGAWTLAPVCGTANMIGAFSVGVAGCVASTGFAVYATGGNVDARSTVWWPWPPNVSANVNTTTYCGTWSAFCP